MLFEVKWLQVLDLVLLFAVMFISSVAMPKELGAASGLWASLGWLNGLPRLECSWWTSMRTVPVREASPQAL